MFGRILELLPSEDVVPGRSANTALALENSDFKNEEDLLSVLQGNTKGEVFNYLKPPTLQLGNNDLMALCGVLLLISESVPGGHHQLIVTAKFTVT